MSGVIKFTGIIDCFEGKKVVLITEDGHQFILPRKWIPKNAQEGDQITFLTKLNKKSSEKLKERVKKQIEDLNKTIL